MEKNKMDTQDLSEIRKLLRDVPAQDADAFDLESILAEVSGTVASTRRGKEQASSPRAVPHAQPSQKPVQQERQPRAQQTRPAQQPTRPAQQPSRPAQQPSHASHSGQDIDEVLRLQVAQAASAQARAQKARAQAPSAPDMPRTAKQAPSAPDMARMAKQAPSAPDMPRTAKQAPSAPDMARTAKQAPSAPDMPRMAKQASSAPDMARMAKQASSAPDMARTAQQAPSAPDMARMAKQAPSAPDMARMAQEQDTQDEAPRARNKKKKKTKKVEQPEGYTARDPRVAQAACLRRSRNLLLRSIFVLLFFVGIAYLSLADGMGWPLPQVLSYATNTVTNVLLMLVLQILAMLVGIDIVGGGLYALFTGQPNRQTLVSFALLATLLHGITIIVQPAWGGLLPYCAISTLLLFASMQEEKAWLAGRQRAFKAATLTAQPLGVYAHHVEKTNTDIAIKTRMQQVDAFLVELEKPDTVTRFSLVYTPIMLAASVIFALVVSLAQGVPSRFFWALSALLVMSAPLGIVCAAGTAYRNVSRRLLAEGAAVSGVCNATALRKTKQVLLTDTDLFPAGSITVDGVRNYGKYSPEKLLAYVCAVTNGQGLEIGRVFSELLREQYGRPVKASNVLQYESGGLSADIGGDSVLVGTASFLMRLHIRIRDIHGLENGVFVVINNQIAGVFALTYHPAAPPYSALHAFRRLRKKPILATRDFNITPAMVESLFEMRNGATEAATDMDQPAQCAQKGTVCGIITHDGVTALTQLLHSADRLVSAARANLKLGVFSGVCGLLLVFYLANMFAVEALQPKNMLLYLLLWYVPVWLANLGTGRKY